MIAGVISFGPSQETPSNGLREGRRADRRPGRRPASTSSKANVAVVGRRRRADRLARRRPCSSTVTPGQAELALLDLARLAAARLEVAPDDAGDRRSAIGCGATRLLRRRRAPRSGGIPVSPSSATSAPAATGVLEHEPLLRACPSSARRRRRARRTARPAGRPRRATTPIAGVDRAAARAPAGPSPARSRRRRTARSPSA